MNTTTAAAQAGVTIRTIRIWCARSVVAAVKQAGRWIIDATSLAARIAIGARYGRNTTMTQPVTATLVGLQAGGYGLRGNADTLAAAFAASTPVTLDNPNYAGERVHLGYNRETWGDHGRTLETVGLAYIKADGQAVYHLNTTNLEEAPKLAAALQQEREELAAAEARAMAADNEYLNPRYM